MSSFLPKGNTLQGPSTVGQRWSGKGITPFSDSLIISNIQLVKPLIGRVLKVTPCKSPQQRIGLRRSCLESRSVLDHHIILLRYCFPVDRLSQRFFEVRGVVLRACLHRRQFLRVDRLWVGEEGECEGEA